MSVIRVENVSKSYQYYKKEEGLKGSFRNLFHKEYLYKQAVKGINFEVQQGDFVGLIGLNGAGKTTTLKMLSGILRADSGNIDVLGYNPFEKKPDFLKQITMVMGNKSQLWWDIPAADIFKLNKEIYDVDDQSYKKIIDELVERFGVENLLHKQIRRLSLGERMKMEIILALIHSPNVLFLDEPTIGLDVVSQFTIRETLKKYNEEHNISVMLTSHNLDDIESLCDKLIIIDQGSIVFNGNMEDFIRDNSRKKRINIKFTKNKRAIIQMVEQYTDLIEEDNSELQVSVDKDQVLGLSNELIREFISDISDISIENTDIEEMIRNFYQ